ncbi:MAG TPA: thioredoxin family protein [Pseudogracilibacillus sp.]|nr:thioredoxin family protein [Pseudogracilibacillus sp.]
MSLNEWFERGKSKDEYMAGLDKHRDAFTHIYENFNVPEEDKATLTNEKELRVLVLAEPWCGHCMLDIPILLKICEEANIPHRFLNRDENLDVMDQYLTNEKRIIPIFIFIDKDGNEVAKWGPWAPEIKAFVDTLKQDLPAKSDPQYDEAFQSYIGEIGSTFRSNESFWKYVYDDVKKTIYA